MKHPLEIFLIDVDYELFYELRKFMENLIFSLLALDMGYNGIICQESFKLAFQFQTIYQELRET